MKTAIIIPARYGSTRFPGKPLAKIAGKTMLQRVVDIAKAAKDNHADIMIAVATEDERILNHCKEISVECLMTSENCATGSDRVLEAAKKLGDFDITIGLQGDAPFTPLEAIEKMIATFKGFPKTQIVTPVVRLRWEELDVLREQKKITPFSGTTATIDTNGRALWFSKNILPAIRKEDELRDQSSYSPVHQHIGLYGFKMDVLEKFVSWPQGHYEQLEGLEQLRLIENGVPIQTVTLDLKAGLIQSGIDSPEDIDRAEKLLSQQASA